MRRVGHATGAVRWGSLLGLLVPCLLAGCASWTWCQDTFSKVASNLSFT